MGDEPLRPPRASVPYPVQRRPTALRDDDGEARPRAGEQGGGAAVRSWFDEMHRAPGMPFAVAGGLLAGALLALVLFRGGDSTAVVASATGPEGSTAVPEPADRATAAPRASTAATPPGSDPEFEAVGAPGVGGTGSDVVDASASDEAGAAGADDPVGASDATPDADADFEVVGDGPAASDRTGTAPPVEITLEFEVEPADVERLRIRVNGTDVAGKTHRLRVDDAVVIEARARGYRTWRRRLRPRTDRTVRIKLRPPTRALPGRSIDL